MFFWWWSLPRRQRGEVPPCFYMYGARFSNPFHLRRPPGPRLAHGGGVSLDRRSTAVREAADGPGTTSSAVSLRPPLVAQDCHVSQSAPTRHGFDSELEPFVTHCARLKDRSVPAIELLRPGELAQREASSVESCRLWRGGDLPIPQGWLVGHLFAIARPKRLLAHGFGWPSAILGNVVGPDHFAPPHRGSVGKY